MITLIGALCLLGFTFRSGSAELNVGWSYESGECAIYSTYGEIINLCDDDIDLPQSCRGDDGGRIDNHPQFEKCASELVWECQQLIGYNFVAGMPINCSRLDVGVWAANYLVEDFEKYKVTAIHINFESQKEQKCDGPPLVTYSLTERVSEEGICWTLEDSPTFEIDRFNEECGGYLNQELGAIASLSVAARSFRSAITTTPDPGENKKELNKTSSLSDLELDPCPVQNPHGRVFLKTVIQGSQPGGGGGGVGGGTEGASLLNQLGATSVISILAVTGLIASNMFG